MISQGRMIVSDTTVRAIRMTSPAIISTVFSTSVLLCPFCSYFICSVSFFLM